MNKICTSFLHTTVALVILLSLQPVNFHVNAYSGFIKDAVGPAQASQAETTVPASVTIAQAILESGWGDKHIGTANNYFGIKCQMGQDGQLHFGSIATGCVQVPTQEWNGSAYISVMANFRTYASMTDSFRDHGHFLLDNPRYAEALKHVDDPKQFAVELKKAGYATGPTYSADLIGLMDQYNLYQYDKVVAPPTATGTATVLVFDTSGSMSESDASGNVKLDAAVSAATKIVDVIAAEDQAAGAGSANWLGIVDFNEKSTVDSPLTTDISAVKSSLQSLYANNGTGMPQGLKTTLGLFGGNSGGKPIVILLSDGMPNIGLNGETDESTVRQQVLDLASQAKQQGICIYTVGLGDASVGTGGDNGLDEDFLKQVASNSGCGTYQNAKNAWQLTNVYIALRHASTGDTLLQKSGRIAQDQIVDAGSVQVPDQQSMILFTLNWPGSNLEPKLVDPKGQEVTSSYPGASFSHTSSLVSVIIQNPPGGSWKISIQGLDVPEGTTDYNAILSARANPNPPAPAPVFGPGFIFVVLVVVIGGAAVGVYVLTQITKRNRLSPVGVVQGANPRLVGLSGLAAGRATLLMDGLLMGRSAACAVQLHDGAVSRQHARLRCDAGHWYIQDLNSTGGTYVNGQRVDAALLHHGDCIRVGGSEFEFRS